jgi:uncharacterized protein (TIGR02145 family)
MRNLIPILLAVVVISYGCDSAETSAETSTENQLTNCGDLVSHEGYNYSTVQIGDQCWFAENCRYLPEVTLFSAWSNTTPQYYVYGYRGTNIEAAKATSNYETYGVLYNWPAVMTEGICPSGWHIPSDGEFTQLTDFLGGKRVAGYVMKSTSGWNDYIGNSGNGSNSSGFNALPGGYAAPGDSGDSAWPNFDHVGRYAYWWSSSSSGSSEAWIRLLAYLLDGVGLNSEPRSAGFSTRCVRD